MKQELTRQTIHILLFALVFLLKTIDYWQMILILLGLLIIAIFYVPRSGWRHYFHRAQDKKFSLGAIYYFSVLIFLLVVFPAYIVACAWAALALGDGFATIVGKKYKGQPLPWNNTKTVNGTITFILATSLGSILILLWLEPTMALDKIFILSITAAVAGGLTESLPIKINDNVSVPLAVALVITLI